MREEPISVWEKLEEEWTRDSKLGKRTEAVRVSNSKRNRSTDMGKSSSQSTDVNEFVSVTDVDESIKERERQQSRSSDSVRGCSLLSLGNVINPDCQINLYRDRIAF